MEVLDNEAERNRENVGRWISGVRGDESMTAMILTLLAEREQLQMELINYMVGHQTATPRELLEKAIEW